MAFKGKENRRAERVEHPYVIRVRKRGAAEEHDPWEICTVKNISKTGVFFYSARHYKLADELEVHVKNSDEKQDNRCRATVVRCEYSTKTENVYGIAVYLSSIDNRESFEKAIDLIIEKKKK